MTLWIVLAVLAALAGFVGWLVWPGAGLRFDWPAAPGGAIRFRLRLGSLLPKLLGADGCAVFGVVHIAGPQGSGYLIGHEVHHLQRQATMGVWRYLWRYTFDKAFHEAEEEACKAFGLKHHGDPFLVWLSGFAKR